MEKASLYLGRPRSPGAPAGGGGRHDGAPISGPGPVVPSHPDCRAALTLFVAPHAGDGRAAEQQPPPAPHRANARGRRPLRAPRRRHLESVRLPPASSHGDPAHGERGRRRPRGRRGDDRDDGVRRARPRHHPARRPGPQPRPGRHARPPERGRALPPRDRGDELGRPLLRLPGRDPLAPADLPRRALDGGGGPDALGRSRGAVAHPHDQALPRGAARGGGPTSSTSFGAGGGRRSSRSMPRGGARGACESGAVGASRPARGSGRSWPRATTAGCGPPAAPP